MNVGLIYPAKLNLDELNLFKKSKEHLAKSNRFNFLPICIKSDKYNIDDTPSQFIESILMAVEAAKHEDCHVFFLVNAPCYILSIEKFENLVAQFLESEKSIGCSISRIGGVGIKNPSRFPYVDSSLLLLDTGQVAASIDAIEGNKFVSHFNFCGYRTALLTTFIENYISNNHVFLLNENCVASNIYGPSSFLDSYKFNYNHLFGFATGFSELELGLEQWVSLNMGGDIGFIYHKYRRSADGVYFRRNFNIISYLKLVFLKIFAFSKYDFKKHV